MVPLVIVGGGAQAKLAAEIALAADVEVACVVDLEGGLGSDSWPTKMGFKVSGLDEAKSWAAGLDFVPCHSSPSKRASLANTLATAGLQLRSLISPSAVVASTADVGPGSIIAAGAVVESFAVLGRSVVIRANSVVEHDCSLGDFVTLAPGVLLAGWVQVGDGSTLFTGAVAKPSIKVGAGATVGAGAVLIHDVPEFATVAGVPARRLG